MMMVLYLQACTCSDTSSDISLISAVSFAIPATATVVEGGAALRVCVLMTAISPAATLGSEVIVNLTTIDGSGNGLKVTYLSHYGYNNIMVVFGTH
jgi:hypothetical protein